MGPRSRSPRRVPRTPRGRPEPRAQPIPRPRFDGNPEGLEGSATPPEEPVADCVWERRCPLYCRVPIALGDRFCTNCGRRLKYYHCWVLHEKPCVIGRPSTHAEREP